MKEPYFELAKKIIRANKSITKHWNDIDFYTSNGFENPDEQNILKRVVEDMSIGDIVKAILTIPSWLTRAKKKLVKLPDGPMKDKLEQEIAIKQQELKEIKSLP